jgi:outer membrane protein TolC
MRNAIGVFILAAMTTLAQPAARTLALREALDAADKLSPDVQQARLRILESEATPQASVLVSGASQTSNLQGIGLSFPGVPSRVGPYTTFNARPVVTQTVLDMSLLTSIRASRERIERFRFDAATVREDTLSAVLQTYLRGLQAESRVTAAEARVVSFGASLKQARELEAAGSAHKLDVARAEEQYHSELAGLSNAHRDAAVWKTLLLRTIGMPPDEAVTLTAPELPAPLPTTMSSAVQGRTEIQSLESQIRTAKLDEQRAARERLPRITAAGDYGVYGEAPNHSVSTYSVGATLVIPITTGGRVAGERKEAQARAKQIEERLRSTRLQIAQEIAQSVIEKDAAYQSLAEFSKAAAAARESLELSRLRFAAGLSTNLDTIAAQSALTQAEDQEIRARYEYHLGAARLARARGDVFLFFEN